MADFMALIIQHRQCNGVFYSCAGIEEEGGVLMKKKDIQFELIQRIGIYYIDEEWKREVFDQIYDYYKSIDFVENSIYSRGNTVIELKDGSRIQFIPANNNSRGMRHTKVLLQSGINKQTIDYRIKPTLAPIGKLLIIDDEGGN